MIRSCFILFIFSILSIKGENNVELVSDHCIFCIKEIVNSTDVSILKDDNYEEFKNFFDCEKDIRCIRKVVRAYINNFSGENCNEDDNKNCVDFVKIYVLGKGHCDSHRYKKYENKFNICQATLQNFT